VFTSDGRPTPVLGIDKESFKAAPQNDVLAFVNVTEPAEGASVSGTFTASGVANSFEATVPWEIRDQDGKKVLDGFATAEGWGDHLYPWESQVDLSGLPPGTYTFVALTDDPSDGEGAGPTEDTKTITVG
jgi:Immunoglobulin-like domain of bacterial spore germination